MESSWTKPIRVTRSSSAFGVAAREGSARSPCAPIRSSRAAPAVTRGAFVCVSVVFTGKDGTLKSAPAFLNRPRLKFPLTLKVALAPGQGVAEGDGLGQQFERGGKVFG